MDMNKMTVKLQEALQAASSIAMRRNHQGVDVEHLIVGLLEQDAGYGTRCVLIHHTPLATSIYLPAPFLVAGFFLQKIHK